MVEIEKDRGSFRRKSTGEDITNVPILDLIFRPLRKRESKAEQKLRAKRKAAVERQYLEGERPRDIAKELGVTRRFVYNSTLTVRDKMKEMAIKAAAGALQPQDLLPTKRTRLRDDPELQRNVRGYLEEHGIHHLTLKKVKDYVPYYDPKRLWLSRLVS